jgi:hypothetical protein
MEGNLRGARHSLLPPSHSINSLKMASELSAQLSAARERDRKLYGALGVLPSRQRSLYSSPLSQNSTSSHSRQYSETFTPGSTPPGSTRKPYPEKRASSALGPMTGPWSPTESPLARSSSINAIRGSRSQEQMRHDRLASWQMSVYEEHPLRNVEPAPRSNSSSGSRMLDVLQEDTQTNALPQRPSSTTSDLRQQMHDLKGRISSLKEKAREDGMKRRSLNSLRTPSPFTQAEIWYHGADAYKGQAVSTDAGVGERSPISPVVANGAFPVHKLSNSPSPTGSTHRKQQGPTLHIKNKNSDDVRQRSEYEESHYEDANEDAEEADDSYGDLSESVDAQDAEYGEEIIASNEADFIDDEHSQSGAESNYMDPEYVPLAERHEDRADAFDYEHFILHSAMGTYSSASRRSSSASDDSAETTRPISPGQHLSIEPDNNTPRPMHHRNMSTNSISTVATFQTATEGLGSDDGSDDGVSGNLSEITNKIIEHNRMSIHHFKSNASLQPQLANGLRADSAIVMPERHTSPVKDAKFSVASRIASMLIETSQSDGSSRTLDQQEKDLIYQLAKSFSDVCSKMQTTVGDEYENKLMRRRLDEARRALDDDSSEDVF